MNTGNYGSEFKWHKPDIVPGIQMVEPFQYPTLESLVFKSFKYFLSTKRPAKIDVHLKSIIPNLT